MRRLQGKVRAWMIEKIAEETDDCAEWTVEWSGGITFCVVAVTFIFTG